MEKYILHQLVTCHKHKGWIIKVCQGDLEGMYEVRLSSGIVCVDGSCIKTLD